MSRRAWLRHPPAVLRPAVCPTGLPRFRSLTFAREALLPVCASVAGLTAVECELCGGAHLVAVDGPSAPAVPP